jgi:hypothetical protein
MISRVVFVVVREECTRYILMGGFGQFRVDLAKHAWRLSNRWSFSVSPTQSSFSSGVSEVVGI